MVPPPVKPVPAITAVISPPPVPPEDDIVRVLPLGVIDTLLPAASVTSSFNELILFTTCPFAIFGLVIAPSTIDLLIKLYAAEVNANLGSSSAPLATVTPSQYCSLKRMVSGFTLPKITLNIPLDTAVVCISVHSSVLSAS